MANPRPGDADRLANGDAQSSRSSSDQQAFLRPFTLTEALPYTPFTSVVTFDSGEHGHPRFVPRRTLQVGAKSFGEANLFLQNQHADVIPIPSLGAGLPAPSVLDLVSTKDFDALNKEAVNAPTGSQRLEHGLTTIQHLLDPQRITQL
jgi:cohesin loading factor subunit SCC2